MNEQIIFLFSSVQINLNRNSEEVLKALQLREDTMGDTTQLQQQLSEVSQFVLCHVILLCVRGVVWFSLFRSSPFVTFYEQQ